MKAVPHRRRAFLLVFALGLTLLTTSILGVVAIRNNARVLQAHQRLSQIQRKWGMRSVERVVGQSAPSLLATQQEEESTAVVRRSEARLEFSLNQVTVDVEVTEEEAKVNVNTLYANMDRDVAQVANFVRKLCAGDPVVPAVLLRPLGEQTGSRKDLAPFMNFSQVIDQASRASLDRFPKRITLWGSGRVDGITADPMTLKALLSRGGVLSSEVSKFIATKERYPQASLSELLRQSAVSERTGREIERKLTDQGSTFSLALHVRDSWHRWTRMVVISRSGDGSRRVLFAEDNPSP
jgi:hypothetical protein